ncbi:MAG: hypothetical protein JWM20_172 [Patescibacteria group bacterium]|nr:hypothetical protein [Patescibacteria group bacterium]
MNIYYIPLIIFLVGTVIFLTRVVYVDKSDIIAGRFLLWIFWRSLRRIRKNYAFMASNNEDIVTQLNDLKTKPLEDRDARELTKRITTITKSVKKNTNIPSIYALIDKTKVRIRYLTTFRDLLSSNVFTFEKGRMILGIGYDIEGVERLVARYDRYIRIFEKQLEILLEYAES